jgi:hypothetical protein
MDNSNYNDIVIDKDILENDNGVITTWHDKIDNNEEEVTIVVEKNEKDEFSLFKNIKQDRIITPTKVTNFEEIKLAPVD